MGTLLMGICVVAWTVMEVKEVNICARRGVWIGATVLSFISVICSIAAFAQGSQAGMGPAGEIAFKMGGSGFAFTIILLLLLIFTFIPLGFGAYSGGLFGGAKTEETKSTEGQPWTSFKPCVPLFV